VIPRTVPWRKARHHWPIYLFVFPALVLAGLFQYYPAASGAVHSLFRWNGSDISEYVGLWNYIDLFNNADFWRSFRIALILGLCNVVKMVPALAAAVCIHRCRSARMQFFYRAMFVIPMVTPGLVVALIWRSFFFEATSGYLNRFLHSTGLFDLLVKLDGWLDWGGIFRHGAEPAWLGDPRLILFAIIIWGFPWVGSFAVLTYLAKLQGIGQDIYEAAEIDGVGWLSKFTRIELPLIGSSIYLLLVFLIIDTIKDAATILALTGFEGGPGGVVTVPALFMIRKAFIDQQMGYACAVGLVLTVVVMLLQKLSALAMDLEQYTPAQRRWRLALLAAVAMALSVTLLGWRVSAIAVIALAAIGFTTRKLEGWSDNVIGKLPVLRIAKHAFIWLVLAFALLPLYLVLIVSVKSNVQFYQAPAAITRPFHFENWVYAWDVVVPTLANSMFISTSATILALVLALGAAYFFARLKMPLSSLLWNGILILMMMPAIANLIPLFELLRNLNLLNTLTALVLVGASGGQIFCIFVLRSFIADVPQDLFEAAEIDGAGHFRQLTTIVVPLCGPVLGTVGLMQFIAMWNEFVLPLIIIRDQSRLPVMVQLVRMAGEYIRLWGPMMAGYAMASVPVIVLFILSMKLFVRGLTEGAVKG
jgi:ABC-type glycerol-3-phosphate transport system permease component